MGRCGAAPHTLTLFKTNIADFPTLFMTEFWFLIPCLRHLINIRACKNFAVYHPRKDILFKTKIDKSIPCLRQNPEKHTLAGRASPLSPYKGVPPPPGGVNGLLDVHRHSQINASDLTSSNRWLRSERMCLGRDLPYISHIGMCCPRGHGVIIVLVWKWVLTLPISLWNHVGFSWKLQECMKVFNILSIPNEKAEK